MRKTWNSEEASDWDDALSDELTIEWILLFQELFEMTEIEFVRCIRPYHSVGDPILVIFSDASKDAYGAVAYAVWNLKRD